MKKMPLIFITIIFILCGCTNLDDYVPIEEYNKLAGEKEQVYNHSKGLLEDIRSRNTEIRELKDAIFLLDNDLG